MTFTKPKRKSKQSGIFLFLDTLSEECWNSILFLNNQLYVSYVLKPHHLEDSHFPHFDFTHK